MNIASIVPFTLPPQNARESDQIFETTQYRSRPYDPIVAWVGDVQDAASLPPLTITSPVYHMTDFFNSRRYLGKSNHFLQISLPIPKDIVDDVRSQLSRTVNSQSAVIFLQNLPRPKTAPLASLSLP